METQPHEPCPRCDYLIHSPEATICSECGLNLSQYATPSGKWSYWFGHAADLWHPCRDPKERKADRFIAAAAIPILLLTTWLAMVGISIEWSPAILDQSGKFLWVGRVDIVLCHWGIIMRHAYTEELDESPLIKVRWMVLKTSSTGRFKDQSVKTINPPAAYGLRWPGFERYWLITLCCMAPTVVIAGLMELMILIPLRCHLKPSVGRCYRKLIRQRLFFMAWRAMLFQSMLILVLMIYDVIVTSLLGTPTTDARLLGYELFGGLIMFEILFLFALDQKKTKLYLSGKWVLYIGHGIVLLLAMTIPAIPMLAGFRP